MCGVRCSFNIMCSTNKNEMLTAIRQQRLEREVAMLEKQVRMLVELAGRSPTVRGKLTNDVVEALEPGAEYIIFERQQMNVLLEGADLHVFLLKELLQELHKPGQLPLEGSGS
jgi:hypothetical protein